MTAERRASTDTAAPRGWRTPFAMGVGALVVVLGLGLTTAQERPLPDVESLLKDLRKTLHSDRALLSQYTYIEKDSKNSVDKQGRVVKTDVEISEMYPSLEPDLTYARLISRNGKPVDPQELDRKDREQQKKVLERMRQLDGDADQKRKRLAKIAEDRRKEDATIDDALALYSISIKGREIVDGHDAIVLDFRPKPDFKVKTDNGKILKKVAGRAWINDADHQLIKVDAEVIDTISFGFGVLAKLNKGAHATFQRRFINNEIWLPAEARFTGNARVLLVKGLRIDVSSEYSGYKKFSVDTSTSFSTPTPVR